VTEGDQVLSTRTIALRGWIAACHGEHGQWHPRDNVQMFVIDLACCCPPVVSLASLRLVLRFRESPAQPERLV